MITTRRQQQGFSLIEQMVALAVGLGLLAALTTLFINASQSQRLLLRSAQQLENGRYAMDVLTQDIHHAGFYGQFALYVEGGALPDPCTAGNAVSLFDALGYPVQAIMALESAASLSDNKPTVRPVLTGTSCAPLLPAANLYPGSDILAIRRANTTPLAVGATALQNEVYIQANPLTAEITFGNGSAITATSKPNGALATVLQKDGVTAALIRKFHVHLYFVAPCSVPAGGGAICTGSSDDQGNPIPTLKRLDLAVDPTTNLLGFNTVSIAEGVEAFKVEVGLDTSPNTLNLTTLRVGDGIPDEYRPDADNEEPDDSEWEDAVSLKVFLVARDSEQTVGHRDTKSYPVATPAADGGTGLVYGPYNDRYRRHAYQSEIRLTNLSGRRENP
jgi:type IV pilus assembly protein PilW